MKRASRHLPTALCVALLLWSAGCASPPPPPPDPVIGDRPEYVIGPGDDLQIFVWKNPDISVNVPVRPDGRITVPLIDDVQAEGLTPLELRDLVAAELEEFVTGARVSVVVRAVKSKRVNVLGQVARPGTVLLINQFRIVDALASVGGFREFSDWNDVKLIRTDGGLETTYIFDYEAYIDGDAPDTNIVLEPGDTIVVPR